MFDPDRYREACSELKLSEEKLQEMILMTEKTKRTVRRPVRVALIAAALAVALGITASAANSEALQSFFSTIRFSISDSGLGADRTYTVPETPEVGLETRDGRVILSLDGAETDITDALEADGSYVYEEQTDEGGYEVTVKDDLTWSVTSYSGDHDTVFTFSSAENSGEGGVSYYAEADGDGIDVPAVPGSAVVGAQ